MKRERIALHRICGIGDAVQMTPLLRQIRADRPEAEITCFISENAAPVLQGAPWIDHVVPLSFGSLKHGLLNPGLVRMWSHISQQGTFDALLCLGPYWKLNALNLLVTAHARLGFVTPGGKPRRIFTHPYEVPANPSLSQQHESAKYLDMWCTYANTTDLAFGYDLPHIGIADESGTPFHDKPRLCVAPGAGNAIKSMETKRWPAASFAKLMKLAAEDGYEIILLGGTGELPAEMIPDGVTNCLGKTSLQQTAALIRHSDGFIGNDSGLFHLALGLDVPAVAFFGPTSARKTGPFRNEQSLVLHSGLPCSPCLAETCILPASEQPGMPRPACMHALNAETAWMRIRAFLHSCHPAGLQSAIR
jgi:ADP-heptose:LPS heptosyltransferase